jgi:hypothetical protein
MQYNRIAKRFMLYKPVRYTDVGRTRRKWEDPFWGGTGHKLALRLAIKCTCFSSMRTAYFHVCITEIILIRIFEFNYRLHHLRLLKQKGKQRNMTDWSSYHQTRSFMKTTLRMSITRVQWRELCNKKCLVYQRLSEIVLSAVGNYWIIFPNSS